MCHQSVNLAACFSHRSDFSPPGSGIKAVNKSIWLYACHCDNTLNCQK